MKIRNVLVIYKKSAYEIHVLEHKNPLFREMDSKKESIEERRLRLSHELHYETVKEVKRVLEEKEVPYKAVYRSAKIDVKPYNLIVSVGGDGTFLEAARRVHRQAILGVNSDPGHSVGSFCAAGRGQFGKLLDSVLKRHWVARKINRLELRVNGKVLPYRVLNDILFCHRNPAAMSRYWIRVGKLREEHRNSGLWVSTAAGSTGAIKSAGGRVLPWESRQIQYWPRELYKWHGWHYRLTGGLLKEGQKLVIGSMIREGSLYLDGPHLSTRFSYGDTLEISNSPFPLNIILPKHR
ncbi:MAG: hypothetical protein A3C47_06405 [Omnitrophica bacterium RIFCSPHIGHO2_02_FULL_51_18]|nr:MAG: hypothetical protein A3C47_06405 [Omnitrophica bacterium RIFCSPHIGHO2_02_FULL_51_18]